MFKILIAEDDLELRQLFRHVLLKNGYTVKGVSDGQEALDALEKDYYDLIISDIMMPNMDGYELVRSLRDAGDSIPVLMEEVKLNGVSENTKPSKARYSIRFRIPVSE